MAMNKTEKAYVTALEEDLKSKQELMLTIINNGRPYYGPDVPHPTSKDPFNTITKGWMYNAYNKTVSRACSSSIGHNAHNDEKTSTQRPRDLYSSELLALQDMRWEVEREGLDELAKIDKRITKLEEEAGQ